MSKKRHSNRYSVILYLSIFLNILAAVYILKKVKSRFEPTIDNNQLYRSTRAAVFGSLPIKSGSVIFIGNSLTESFPVSEYFPGSINRGVATDRITDMLARINTVSSVQPSKLFIMAGINDILADTPLPTMQANYKTLLDSIPQDTKVYIQSTLPLREGRANTPEQAAQRNENIYQWNAFLQKVATERGNTFVNLHPYFEYKGLLNPELTFDGVHLSAKGYTTWANALKPYF